MSSSADGARVSSLPAPTRPRHAEPVDERFVRARRWTVAVLAAGTVVLLGYLALLAAAMWLFASAWGVLRPADVTALDLLALLRPALPALLVGWCGGFAALATMARGEALGPRATGVAAGLVGVLAGALVLALTGTL